MDLVLPPELAAEIRELVALGEFRDEQAAVIALVRVGLGYRYRRSPTPPMPTDPPPPRVPGLPGDVNWIPP